MRYLAREDWCFLEMEIGLTGEEDGVDNSDVAPEDLCSSRKGYQVCKALQPIAPDFYSIAAAFDNVHGVYSPGNVKLTPKILASARRTSRKRLTATATSRCTLSSRWFRFLSGRDRRGGQLRCHQDEHRYGHPWSFWDGVKVEAEIRLPQSQIRRSEKPNKKYYVRAWIRGAEQATVTRLLVAHKDLGAKGALDGVTLQ